jgi:hypothetical protein
MRGASSPPHLFVFMILNCAGQFFSGNSAHYVLMTRKNLIKLLQPDPDITNYDKSRDSAVGTATGYGLDDRGVGV